MFKPTIKQVRAVLATKNHKFFDGKKPYDLNIIGIRSISKVANLFNETLAVIYKDEFGDQHIDYFRYTTKPGIHYLKNPLHPDGCAILQEGQHLGAMKMRKHRGVYNALCQAIPLPFFRDGNKDSIHDFTGKIFLKNVGLNIHQESPSRVSKVIGKYSAGCGVIQARFEYFMFLIKQGIKHWGNKFTYTLINEKDFNTI